MALGTALLQPTQEYCSAEIAKVVLTINVPEQVTLDTSNFQFPIVCVHNPRPQGFGSNHTAFSGTARRHVSVLNPDIRLQ